MRGPIYIAGPTASGKSAVALVLADEVNGEIISVDSMQVYRGMDIGTAKPTPAERARVRHHLIDVAEIHESFDVARFLDSARRAETEIRARGHMPIYCGGTGLYLKALSAGIGSGPPANPKLREELEAKPSAELLAELEAGDPETFAKIDRSNRRRLIRAIEVIRTTGEQYSTHRADWTKVPQNGSWFVLERDRTNLVTRIDARVDRMFADGLVEETRRLLSSGLDANPTAMQSLGYRQVIEHLRGERDLAQTIALVKQKTRQFAKRQMTWFRHQLKLQWLKMSDQISEGEVVNKLIELATSDDLNYFQSIAGT